jgi:hypothetical protein
MRDNPIKNKIKIKIYKETTLEKTINMRQPGKKQTDKEKTLDKNNG